MPILAIILATAAGVVAVIQKQPVLALLGFALAALAWGA